MKSIVRILKQLDSILTKKQKRWAVVVFVMSLIGAVAEMLGVSAILPLVQVMLEPEKVLKYKVVSRALEILGIQGENSLFYFIATGVIIVYVLKNIYLCILAYVRVTYATKVQRELSLYMLYSYANRGYDFFRTSNTADLLRGTTSSVSGVYNLLYHIMKIVTEVLTVVCIGVFIFITDPQMTISVCFMLSISLIIVLKSFKKTMQEAGNKYFQGVSETSKWALQLFAGIKEILLLNRKDYFVINYERAYKEQQDGQIRQTVAAEIPAFVIEGVSIIGLVIAVCIRVRSMDNTVDFIPELAAFAVAAFRLLPSVGRISSSYNNCVFSLPSLEEVYDNYLEASNIMKDEVVSENKEEKYKLELKDELVIEHIEWKYPDGEDKILDDISLVIKKGEAVAFVGPSGAGKSTLVDIILGLFKPQKGRITIDGVDCLRNNEAFAKIIGYVPQMVYMIDDTIRRNVAFGIEDNEISEQSVWDALKQAQLDSFVKSLPQGLDTIIGERGIRFSGGQTQRLAIARALYSNPEILILDEATSALDSETESSVMEAIEVLQGKKTLIIIAHRIATLKNCDRIYEINNGKITEKKYSEIV